MKGKLSKSQEIILIAKSLNERNEIVITNLLMDINNASMKVKKKINLTTYSFI